MSTPEPPSSPPAPPPDPPTTPVLAPPTPAAHQVLPPMPMLAVPPTAASLTAPSLAALPQAGNASNRLRVVASIAMPTLALGLAVLALRAEPGVEPVRSAVMTEQPADGPTTFRAIALIGSIVAVSGRGDATATCDLVTHRLALYLSGFTRTCEDTIDGWWFGGEPAFAPIDVRHTDVRVDVRHPDLVVVRVPPARAPSGPAGGSVYLLLDDNGTLRVDGVVDGWDDPLDEVLDRQRAVLALDAERQDVDPRRARPAG